MTSFRIERLAFTREQVGLLRSSDAKFTNWPAVYTLGDSRRVYVGESLNVAARLRQHLESVERRGLGTARVVIDPTFNKSVCLDLESTLIRWLAGDGRYQVVNRNDGITNADYFDRQRYQEVFRDIFEQLRAEGLFVRSIEEIENSDLFKLSPFKALTLEQSLVVEDILEGLFADIAAGRGSRIVIQGDPGTGKTVVAIYLMKLLRDIQNAVGSEAPEGDSVLSDFFAQGYPELVKDFRIGLVVPQQSLRKTVQLVFRNTPGLDPRQVLSPFEAVSRRDFDLLIVDEAHRLNQRAAQAAGPLNAQFRDNNVTLFGADDPDLTQFDWIDRVSRHQLYLVDGGQAVRPADVPAEVLGRVLAKARDEQRYYRLQSQMRVRAGEDYVGYVRSVLSGTQDGGPQTFEDYDLRFFDDLGAMRRELRARERRHGLSRLLAGYAWRWASKNDPTAFDIEIDGERMRWNSTAVDWVSSAGSVEEVGSIHTVQGYDLNYAGVIIGPDLRYDATAGRIVFDRSNYRDARGLTNNKARGITYTDEDILVFVRNIYTVLLTRGMLGTYVYVCDPALREHLRPYFARPTP